MSSKALRPSLALAAFLAGLVFCGAGQAKPDCTSALLQDWRDGRIDATYSVGCYRAALAQLPEDLRIYSSAESDIRRALQARSDIALSAKAGRPNRSGGTHRMSPLLIVAISAAALAAMGFAAALRR